MKIETAFFRTKVARRIFILFGSCAFISIIVVATFSFFNITRILNDQSKEWLLDRTRVMTTGIFEFIKVLRIEMENAAVAITPSSPDPLRLVPQNLKSHLEKHFLGMIIINETGRSIPLFGETRNFPVLTPKEKDGILSGNAFLSTEYAPGSPVDRIFMGVAGGTESLKNAILMAEINIEPVVFMGLDEPPVPVGVELCLLDDDYHLIYSTPNLPISFLEQVKLKRENALKKNAETIDAALDQFEWFYGEKKYLSSKRPIFIASDFSPRNSKNWHLFLSHPKKEILKTISDPLQLALIFLIVIIPILFFVWLLSSNVIRRSLVPLERLKEGTERIARKEFSSRVIVKSRDEFEEVAESFNSMASQLGRHFKTLTTVAEIDRAVLSVLDKEKIVDTVLNRMREVFPCNAVSVTMIDSKSAERAQTYLRDGQVEQERLLEMVEIKPQDIQSLYDNPVTLRLESGEVWPGYLLPLAKRGSKSFLILPIFIKQELAGIVSLGYLQPPELTQEDLDQARQLADQVAVAFSNVRLIEELDRLNWGTLRALARAIDAKSSWTAGHSERGTRLALQIGEKMGLSKEDIDDLHRGGLLHDIGKIGISPEILDKPGKLTDEERQMMNRHVTMGARILEPIAAYAKVIPIVLQHHECFDGKGYPDGLAGEAISLGARIFAVADRFEALTSERPYRKALHHKHAVQYIKKRAGTEFDPKVVQAFLESLAEEEGIKL